MKAKDHCIWQGKTDSLVGFFLKKTMVVVGKWTINSKALIHIHRKAELKSVHAFALLCQKAFRISPSALFQ